MFGVNAYKLLRFSVDVPVIGLNGRVPRVSSTAFIASTAYVIGDVILGEYVSVWPYAVIRGDSSRIIIGDETNIQDGVVIHADPGYVVNIGRGVSVGHRAVIHGASVGDEVIIGMGSIILNGAEIGSGSIVGAGALVTQGSRIPPGSLVLGIPARVVRQLGEEDREYIRNNYRAYLELVRRYRDSGVNL
jgi:carbonic anhydrase/acetyltransferase-like protein (isoleucine patch superfamily)